MLNSVLALLVRFSQLTSEEAKKISEEVHKSIQPSRYEDAEKMVNKILDDLAK